MKRILYIIVFLTAGLSVSCNSLLDLPNQTSFTPDKLYSSADGFKRAVVGLYVKDRSLATGDATEYIVLTLDYSTDLMVFRGGTAAAFARLNGLNPSNASFKTIWQQYYQIIGKANEIINYGEEFGLDNEEVHLAWAEAKTFRARAYFELYKRFERLYINTGITTVNNAFDKVYRPSSKSELFEVIKTDLDEAIEVLPWVYPGAGEANKYANNGRWNKAAAKHMRAQVAMWEEDWDTAIDECEDIFGCSDYGMMPRTIDVFNNIDLRSKEILLAYQFSGNPGGGNSTSDGVVNGHRVSLNVTPNYKKLDGMINATEYGGYGWGRIYPNTYLLGLYDQAKDKRYSELFFHGPYLANDPNFDYSKVSFNFGEPVTVTTGAYFEQAHPSSLKYYDYWSDGGDPEKTTSFKDLPIYRLAETYLMACEAYFHRDGGGSAKAIEYYNATWKRAGNDEWTAALTLDDIIDEYARECHFEGVRWGLLKRLGLLEERVHLHNGDTKTEDPNMGSDAADARTNFTIRDWCWPIPQTELDAQGMKHYGQNPGWL